MGISEMMRTLQQIARKIPFVTNGEALVGLAFVVAGGIIAWDGAGRLLELWRQLSPFLPFSVPSDLLQRLMVSLPLVFKLFICLVSSICGVLIGALWFFSGFGQIIRSRRKAVVASAFENPALVAESLRRAEPVHWTSPPLSARILARLWPAARLMSPVSYEMFRSLLRSSVAVLFWGVMIAIVIYLLHITPALLQGLLQRKVALFVPSAGPLYFLVGFVIVANVLMALSLVPFKRFGFQRSSRALSVRGHGNPHFFFALIEEGCRLLTPGGYAHRAPIRMEQEGDPRAKGTLIESDPAIVRSLGRVGGYPCLLLAALLLIMGFSRLMHFQRPVTPVMFSDFFSLYFLDYLLEVAFSVGMIICGLHFAEWARKLFGIRKFHSTLIFCHVTVSDPSRISVTRPSKPSDQSKASEEVKWQVVQGIDAQFANWARRPQSAGRFHLEAFWGEVSSEAVTTESSRHLTGVEGSQPLDDAMERILELPFHVSFQVEALAAPKAAVRHRNGAPDSGEPSSGGQP